MQICIQSVQIGLKDFEKNLNFDIIETRENKRMPSSLSELTTYNI